MQTSYGVRAMLPREILNLDILKSLETCIFLFLQHFQRFQGEQPSYKKRSTLPKSLKSGGGHVPPVSPVPTPMSTY